MISIIVPVYNIKDMLIKCLDSLEKQTVEDMEVIIVDDGSTDGSGQIIDDFCKNKDKFIVYHKENGGLMSAWMYGVSKAHGDYFGFVDSDDFVEYTMFEEMYSIALKKNVDIVMCSRFDHIGETVKTENSFLSEGLYIGEDMDYIKDKILPTFSGNHIANCRWNKIFRREIFEFGMKYCSDYSRICEDRFITPPCVFYAQSFYFLNKPLYHYVHREGSNSGKFSKNLQTMLELLYRRNKEAINDLNLENKYLENVERANLNYLRLLINRNFLGKKYSKEAIELAKKLLGSSTYRHQVKKYKKDLTGRMGIAVKLLFALRSARLFVFVMSKS